MKGESAMVSGLKCVEVEWTQVFGGCVDSGM